MAHHRIRTGSYVRNQCVIMLARDFNPDTPVDVTGLLPQIEHDVVVSQFDGIDPADLCVPGVYLGKVDTGRHHQIDTLEGIEAQTFAFYRHGRNEIWFSGLPNPSDPHHEPSRLYTPVDHSDKTRRAVTRSALRVLADVGTFG